MPAERFVMPTLETTPALPADGIHFDMPFETYLAAPAVGSGDLKAVLTDPLRFWARSWMNPKPPKKDDEKEKAHFLYGRALHCHVLEGGDEFEARFYVEPDKADYKDLIETDGQLRAAIADFDEKPVSGNKPERVRQLLELWPDAPVWDHIVAQAERDAGDRCAIKAEWARQFELASTMAENDPDILPLISEGHSEVSLFWHCPLTGIPKKARADKLLIDGIVDLKSLANSQERPLEEAAANEIANRRYPLQVAHYLEGAAVLRALIRQGKADIFQPVETFDKERHAWAEGWAAHDEPDRWHWIFVQKGEAPGVLGWEFETSDVIAEHSELIVRLAQQFGAEPWIVKRGVVRDANNKIPAYVMRM
jgi:hypothetical protein